MMVRAMLHYICICLLAVYTSVASAQVRFGSTLTLSGSAASYGENAREGMELARDEINASGGINGEKLEIILEDFGEIDLKRAASAAQKLVAVDRVVAILPMVTEDAEVIYPIAVRHNLITMAIYAGGRGLTQGKRLFYQVSSDDEALVKRLADYLVASGRESACILSEEGAYALPLAQFAKNYLSAKLSSTPIMADYAPQVVDFRSILTKLRASGCASLILVTPPTRQGIILKQMAELQWSPLKLGLDASEDHDVLQIAGTGADDLVYVKYDIGTSDFRKKFKLRFKREPGVPAALAYDAVIVLAMAMNHGGISGSKVAEYLDELKEFDGASGKIRFANGTRTERPISMWTIHNGKPQPASE